MYMYIYTHISAYSRFRCLARTVSSPCGSTLQLSLSCVPFQFLFRFSSHNRRKHCLHRTLLYTRYLAILQWVISLSFLFYVLRKAYLLISLTSFWKGLIFDFSRSIASVYPILSLCSCLKRPSSASATFVDPSWLLSDFAVTSLLVPPLSLNLVLFVPQNHCLESLESLESFSLGTSRSAISLSCLLKSQRAAFNSLN